MARRYPDVETLFLPGSGKCEPHHHRPVTARRHAGKNDLTGGAHRFMSPARTAARSGAGSFLPSSRYWAGDQWVRCDIWVPYTETSRPPRSVVQVSTARRAGSRRSRPRRITPTSCTGTRANRARPHSPVTQARSVGPAVVRRRSLSRRSVLRSWPNRGDQRRLVVGIGANSRPWARPSSSTVG